MQTRLTFFTCVRSHTNTLTQVKSGSLAKQTSSHQGLGDRVATKWQHDQDLKESNTKQSQYLAAPQLERNQDDETWRKKKGTNRNLVTGRMKD